MSELVLLAKDLAFLMFWILIGVVLLWFIVHIFMMIYKTLFCDYQVKLYKTWKKRLKCYMNDDELEKVIDEFKRQKKF